MAEAEADLREHLLSLESALQSPDVRGDEARLRELLAPDFREFGRSGGDYSFDDIVAALTTETAYAAPAIEDFEVASLSETVALATYRGARTDGDGTTAFTNRSSIWRLDPDGGWRMVFHQGTATG